MILMPEGHPLFLFSIDGRIWVTAIGGHGSEIRGGLTVGWFRLVKIGLIFPRGGVNRLGWFRLV